jgi:glyoxalase family protein
MTIVSLHHITLISSDARRTVDYYTRVLGLRLLAQTVTSEAEPRRRVIFGAADARPGGLIVFIEEPGAQPGREGVGGTHHFALLVETRDALLKWKRRLTDHGVSVNGPLDRHYFESIYHRDPDGSVIEIATRGAGWSRDEEPDRIGTEHRPPPPDMVKGNRDQQRIRAETWPEPVPEVTNDMAFQLLHHITAIGEDIERTHEFLHGLLGLRRVKRTSNFDMPDSYHWYWGSGDGAPGTVVTYFERKGAARVQHGPGQTDHYALAVENETALREWERTLRDRGQSVTGMVDGVFFRSIFTRDPDGQTVELATTGPGVPVQSGEEPRLVLPATLEDRREELEKRFPSVALSSR